MHFVDEVTIVVRSGRGGDGCVSFKREKFRPRGGPDGGNGGKGGDVILVADARMNTLLDYRYKLEYAAPDGRPGEPSRKSGKSSDDLVLPVPPGTRVLDESGALLADLVDPGDRFVAAAGGRGGRGNMHFATPTRQAPDFAKPGGDPEERTLHLELRVLADVGLVGLPNTGKSTLIRRISSARPRVADYPFTTLVPNLGVVARHDKRFIVADLPGLIGGASEGKGLGHRFLRHLSRTRVLVFLLAPEGELSPPEALNLLRAEIAAHDPALLERPQVIALSKADLAAPGSSLHDDLVGWETALRARHPATPILRLSGVSGVGIDLLLDLLAERVVGLIPPPPEEPEPYDPLA